MLKVLSPSLSLSSISTLPMFGITMCSFWVNRNISRECIAAAIQHHHQHRLYSVWDALGVWLCCALSGHNNTEFMSATLPSLLLAGISKQNPGAGAGRHKDAHHTTPHQAITFAYLDTAAASVTLQIKHTTVSMGREASFSTCPFFAQSASGSLTMPNRLVCVLGTELCSGCRTGRRTLWRWCIVNAFRRSHVPPFAQSVSAKRACKCAKWNAIRTQSHGQFDTRTMAHNVAVVVRVQFGAVAVQGMRPSESGTHESGRSLGAQDGWVWGSSSCTKQGRKDAMLVV